MFGHGAVAGQKVINLLGKLGGLGTMTDLLSGSTDIASSLQDWNDEVATSVSGVNEGVLVVDPGTFKLSSDVTISANVSLVMEKGATFSIDSGVTLTINGPFMAGPYQCFAGSGTAVFGAGSVEYGYAEWWGIDGTADEVEINYAITALDQVRLLDRTYSIAATVSLASNKMLKGNGETSVIDAGSLNDAIIEATDASKITIKDIKILGDADYTTNTSQQGVNLVNCANCTVDNVTAQDVSRNGIRVAGEVDGTGTAEHNIVTNCRAIDCDSGIWLFAGASHCTVHGNTVTGSNRYGIVLDDGSTGETNPRQCTDNAITSNTIDSCGYSGIHNESCSYNIIAGNTVENCGTTTGYDFGGIVVTNAQNANKSIGVAVIGNVVENSGDDGIEIVGSSRCLVLGNRVEEYCQRTGNTTGHGIQVRSITYGGTTYHSDHNVIKGNYVWQTTAGNAGSNPIALDDSNVRYSTVEGNYARNENLTLVQWLANSGTSSHISVNILANTSAEAVTAYQALLSFYLSAATDYFLLANVAGGDTNPRFRIRMDGRVEWGDGTNATDTLLYRSGASVLTTQDLFDVVMANATDVAIAGSVSGDSTKRFAVRADGQLQWGSGSATRDTVLYREAASTLATEDVLHIIRANGTDSFIYSKLAADANARWLMDANGKMAWGDGTYSRDTNLYRLASGVLKSDDTIVPGGAVGTMSGNETFAAGDGNIFIKDPGGAARNFNPSGTFQALHQVTLVNTADAAETITFDSAGLNQAVAQNERGIFVYNGSAWLKVYVGS